VEPTNGAIPNTGNEAPASWTVRYHTAEGFDAMLTLRGATGGDVLTRGAAAVKWLAEHECTPDGCRPAAAQPVPTAEASPEADPSWCTIHQAHMKMHTSNGQSWYSHKIGDEWCRGGKAK
jgi:hypothetical protein